MHKFILAIAALAFSTTALAMGVTPQAMEVERAADKVIAPERLVEVRVAAQTIREARVVGASTASEIKATAGHLKAADNALSNAINARRALNVAEFEKQAAIVFANRDKACAILSGC